MQSIPRFLVSAAGVLVTLAGASAQSLLPQGSLSPLSGAEPATPIHTAAADQGIEYGVWAAGADYKVSFHDGMTFVPLLGRDYPRNQPLHWTTTSVAVGGVELVTRAPSLRYGDWRAEYDLGGVVEAYDVRREEVEQTFVLARRPAAAGDLVVQGRFVSDLRCDAREAAHQGLVFSDDAGNELIRYGAAVAIDADGNRRPMTTAFEDGRVTLQLDGPWLETARFPLVIDPIITSTSFALGAARDEVDCVRDTNAAPFGFVWSIYSVWASAIDRDVYGRIWDENATGLSAPYFTDLTTSWSTFHARIAFSPGNDHAAMVFNRFFPSLQISGVRYHLHDAGNTVLNTSVSTVPHSDQAWRPDVGGAALPFGGGNVVVVWQQEENNGPFSTTSGSNIYGCTINTSTNSVSPPFDIDVSPFRDSERPTVNQVRNGLFNDHWLCAYQQRSNFIAGSTWDVSVRSIESGNQVSGPMTIDPGSSHHQLAPHVAGAGGRYLVAYTNSAPTQVTGIPSGINGHQLRVTRLDWTPGASSGNQPWNTNVVQAATTASWQIGGVAFDRNTDSHWLVSFRSSVTGALSMRTIGHRGQSLQFENILLAGTSELTRCSVSFNEFTDQYHLMFGTFTAAPGPGTLDATVHYRYVYPTVSPAVTEAANCSQATISWVGSQLIGNEFGKARVSGAAVDSLHVMALAKSQASVSLFGIPIFEPGCLLLIPSAGPNYLGVFPLAVGDTVDFNLPLPEFLTSDTYYFQDFHTIGNGNLQLRGTERLAVPVVK